MSNIPDYIENNKASWNSRTEYHVRSGFYGINEFLQGKSSLNEIELKLLGDLRGKTLLHLQCHFGQDSISLARMGASVRGVDFSDKAIEQAEQLAAQTKADASFTCCDIYDLPNHLDQEFDIVFTSYGTIGWLPDLDKWAAIIARYLKPGGRFVFAEFHPVVWMFDNDFTRPTYPYLKAAPIIEIEKGTYADRDAPIENKVTSWNHGLGEVVTALLNAGLRLDSLEEYDYSPYACFKNTIEFEPGKFRIQGMENFLPMVYSLTASKPLPA